MLAQDIPWSRTARVAVKVMIQNCLKCGNAFDYFEPICRNEDRFGWRVVSVVGAPDALNKAFYVFWRADLHDKIDIPPIDA